MAEIIARSGIVAAALALAAVLHPGTARAEDRDFCADRPGRGTPACTLSPGQAMIEVGVIGWDHSADAGGSNDSFNLADTLLRVGVTQQTELQVGIAGYTRTRARDKTGVLSEQRGIGDGYIAVRQGLAGDNGPAAIEAFVTLPLGKPPAGAGDWGAGLLLPFGKKLGGGFELALTPEADLAVNASGHGRHPAYGGVIGVSHTLAKDLSATGEVFAFEDNDPDGHAFDARVAGSLAWQVGKRLQLDFEGDLGVSHAAPKRALMIGFARRIG